MGDTVNLRDYVAKMQILIPLLREIRTNREYPQELYGIRNELLLFVVLYRDLHCKLAAHTIGNLNSFLGYFTNLTLEQFRSNIDLIGEDSKKYVACSNIVASAHNRLAFDLEQFSIRVEYMKNEKAMEVSALRHSEISHQNRADDRLRKMNSGRALQRTGTVFCIIGAALTGPIALATGAAAVFSAYIYSDHQSKERSRALEDIVNACLAQGRAQDVIEAISGKTGDCIQEFGSSISLISAFWNVLYSKIEYFSKKLRECSGDLKIEQEFEEYFNSMVITARGIIEWCNIYQGYSPIVNVLIENLGDVEEDSNTMIDDWIRKEAEYMNLDCPIPADGKNFTTGWEYIQEIRKSA